jgi:hypothetical protein
MMFYLFIFVFFVSMFSQRYLNRQDANQISYESYVDSEKCTIYVRYWDCKLLVMFEVGRTDTHFLTFFFLRILFLAYTALLIM